MGGASLPSSEGLGEALVPTVILSHLALAQSYVPVVSQVTPTNEPVLLGSWEHA